MKECIDKDDLCQLEGILKQFNEETIKQAFVNTGIVDKAGPGVDVNLSPYIHWYPIWYELDKLKAKVDANQVDWAWLTPCSSNMIHYDPDGTKVCLCIEVRRTSSGSRTPWLDITVDGDKAGKIHAPGKGTICGKKIEVHGDGDSVEFRFKYGKC